MGFRMQATIGLMVFVFLTPMVLSRTRFHKIQTDPLMRTRCDLTCFDIARENRTQCRSQCRLRAEKPGTCPSNDSPHWAAACVEACTLDSQCDGTQRCCRHGCGSTCSEPTDLLTLSGLPALPRIEEVKERKKSVVIRWSDGVGDLARAVPGYVLYLLEEQHHLGPKYEVDRLGGWSPVMRTNKTKISLRNLLKPGRWYRFRAASISAAGSRGFSDPSAPFTPRKGPRAPPPPKRLRVRPVRAVNGTVTIRLEWKEPNSDLPVLRYKVFWSRRVRGVTGDLDSVLVNHVIVPKGQTSVEIMDLKPNAMYFLQVQTISQYGFGKLRSDKAAIFYNTTNPHELTFPALNYLAISATTTSEALHYLFRDEFLKLASKVRIVQASQRRKYRTYVVPGWLLGTTIKTCMIHSFYSFFNAKSEKEGDFDLQKRAPQSLQKRDKRIVKGLKLNKVIWHNNKLKARINWEPLPDDRIRRYFVQWRTEKCQNPLNENKILSATTEQTSFEIYELEYHCSYKVNVNNSKRNQSPDSEIMVVVPDCDYFQRRMNSTNLNCD